MEVTLAYDILLQILPLQLQQTPKLLHSSSRKVRTVINILVLTVGLQCQLSETPDWAFMRENQHKIAFLFGIDDHWGPLQMFEEVI